MGCDKNDSSIHGIIYSIRSPMNKYVAILLVIMYLSWTAIERSGCYGEDFKGIPVVYCE